MSQGQTGQKEGKSMLQWHPLSRLGTELRLEALEEKEIEKGEETEEGQKEEKEKEEIKEEKEKDESKRFCLWPKSIPS